VNIHHLELFYYVARHGGVSAAARHIPYGVQQPAISAQVIQLEDSLGVALFQRRPFELTKEGRELFRFVEPFFSGITGIGTQLRGGRMVRLRIGAPEAVQILYLPALLHAMRKRMPELVFTLGTGTQDSFEEAILAQEMDIAFASVHHKPRTGIRVRELARVPLALLVREKSWIKTADQLWKLDRIEEPLLATPPHEPVSSIFYEELRQRKVEWYPSLELASLELVGRYVAEGFGVGLTVIQKDVPTPKGTRQVPLTGFPPVPYAALWLGKANPLIESVLEEAGRIAARLA
jgi:DNA-binding transcriptional LysR family regulator